MHLIDFVYKYILKISEKYEHKLLLKHIIFLCSLLSWFKVSLSPCLALCGLDDILVKTSPPFMSTRVKKTSAIHHSWINFSLPSIWSCFLASSCSCHRAQMKPRLQCRTMWPQQFLLLFIRSDIDNRWKDSYRVLPVIPQTFAWIIIISSVFPLPFGIPNLQITRFPFQHWNWRDLSRSLLSSQITHEIMQWGPYDGANLQFLLLWLDVNSVAC